MSALGLHGVGKRYDGVAALSGIDLRAAAGTRTAIVGPSGSGKTTLLRLIAGFEAPDEGEIRLNGHQVATAAASVPAHLRNIGLVMQDGALFPHLSVLDNVRFGMEERRQRDGPDRALQLLDLVELDRAMAARQPHELSGGQQQRVALARALARRPGLMLLDEPFSALDTGLREQMRQATAGILERAGITTVLVTHDQEEAMGFGSQLVVLRGGRLVQAGPPREVYLAPTDPVTAAFLGEAIVLPALAGGGFAECALGRVTVANGREGPVTLLLRPEQIALRPDADANAGAEAQVRARLLATDFAGPTARVTLGIPGASPAISFRRPAASLPPPGSTVAIALTGPAHVFPAPRAS